MAPCKWQVKGIRHLVCGSCGNWVDFVKSGCKKSWAEVQVDSLDDKVGEGGERDARES